MSKKQLPPSDKDQSDRFIKAAKQAEADETGEAFEQASKVLLKSARKPSDLK